MGLSLIVVVAIVSWLRRLLSSVTKGFGGAVLILIVGTAVFLPWHTLDAAVADLQQWRLTLTEREAHEKTNEDYVRERLDEIRDDVDWLRDNFILLLRERGIEPVTPLLSPSIEE